MLAFGSILMHSGPTYLENNEDELSLDVLRNVHVLDDVAVVEGFMNGSENDTFRFSFSKGRFVSQPRSVNSQFTTQALYLFLVHIGRVDNLDSKYLSV
jgi:hypothetical protein